MRGVGCRGFCAVFGLLVMRCAQKKWDVRISPIFFALTGRTPGGVGLVVLELRRHKKGGVDDLGKLRSGALAEWSNFVRYIFHSGEARTAVGGPLL